MWKWVERIAVLGAAAAVLYGAFRVYHAAETEVPQIKEDLKKLDALIAQAGVDQQAALERHADAEKNSREDLGRALNEIRTQLLVLQSKTPQGLKEDDVRRLISTYKSLGSAEGTKFRSYSVVAGSPFPKVPAAVTSSDKYWDLFRDGQTATTQQVYAMMGSEKYPVNNYLPMLLLAKNGKWEITDSGVKVIFDGGIVSLFAREGISQDELKDQVRLFNSLSSSVQVISKGVWKSVPDTLPSKPELKENGSRSDHPVPLPNVPSGAIRPMEDFKDKLRQVPGAR
jgi:hypothetical protein